MTKEIEEWRDIEGYEGLYQVSNLGRVKSCNKKVKHRGGFKTYPEKIMSQGDDRDGYKILSLCKEGKKHTKKVNRLVGFAFIHNPKPDKYDKVHHEDHIKYNNHHSNLRWVDNSINTKEAYRVGATQASKGEDSPCSLLTNEDALFIYNACRDTDVRVIDLADKYNVKRSTISNILAGRRYVDVTGGVPIIRRRISDERIEEVIDLLDKGTAISKIVKLVGVSKSLVRRVDRKEHGYFKKR
tara:strand:+ start:380 stop:1102 length:723 start_codon:yes stop_codon:yes gene_type:complete